MNDPLKDRANEPFDDGRRAAGECAACPVGAFFAQAQAASPDAMEHVLNAAQELLAAARIAIDAAEAAIEQQRAARSRPDAPRVRRIDIA